MSSSSPLWISIDKNAYNPNSGTPVISRGMNERMKQPDYDQSTDEIKGLRSLPSAVVERIFLLAGQESSYTRWYLPQVCKSWRELAFKISKLWSKLFISENSSPYERGIFTLEGSRLRYWNTTVHVCLSSPSAVQLYDLVGFAATTQWESLHIILGERDIDPATVEVVFAGASFPRLKTLRVEEGDLDFGRDPYAALYDAIFLTATRVESLYVNSDLKDLAQQYGLFGQRVTTIGGSTGFISRSLPVSDPETYSHITRLSVYRWDFDVIANLTLPSLQHLQVDHCPHEETNRNRPSIILPSLIELHLTAHSLLVLSQICAGGVESLIIDQTDYNRWYSNVDDCLPPSTYGESNPLGTFDLDVWSTPSLERVHIYTLVSAQHLLTFLHNAKGLIELTLAVPDNREWCDSFIGAMGARWGHGNHLAHCPQLETLTLLMDWGYKEGEWLEEIRTVFNAREDTVMKSIICRWTEDARNPESGPAGNFDVFGGGEYYGGAGEPEVGGPNLPSESKQVEPHVQEVEEDDSDHSDEMEEEEDDDDDEDMLDLYDDIPFP